MVVTTTQSHWTTAVSGNFTDATKWTPTGVPGLNNDVYLDGVGTAAYTVTATVTSAPITVDFLSVNANATLAIAGAGVFTIDSVAGYPAAYNLGKIDIGAGATMLFGHDQSLPGEIFNNGQVNLAAGATLEIAEPFFNPAGTGVFNLTAGSQIIGDLSDSSSPVFDNFSNVIQGAGTIGNGSAPVGSGTLSLQNDGQATIDATGAAGQALILNTGSNKIHNAGLIETTGAGGLVIDSAMDQEGILNAGGAGALTIANSVTGGGTVEVSKTGASIVLSNGTLNMEGTISTVKGGSITTKAATSDLLSSGDIENAGTIAVVNNSTLRLNASVYDNGGTVQLAGSTLATELEITGDGVSLYGTGSLVMANSAKNSIVSNGSGEQVSNYSTISGAGTIGDTFLRLYNAVGAVVNANDSVGMTIVGVSAGSESADYNAGTVETTGAGGLTIDGNFGDSGALKATGAGALKLVGGTITAGGLLETTAAGASIILDNTVSIQNSVDIFKGSKLSTTTGDVDTLGNVFNNGTINVTNGSTLQVENTYDNTGVINLNGAGTTVSSAPTTVLEVEGGLTLTGGGIVDLTNLSNATLNAITGDVSNPANSGIAYLNNLNNTIEGAGVIGDLSGAGNLAFNNSGTIDATGAKGAALNIEALANHGYNTGTGTIKTMGAGGLNIFGTGDLQTNAALFQDGKLIADGTGALSLNAAWVGGSGSAQVALAGASIVLTNSTLDLQGTVSIVAGGSLVAAGGADELDAGEIDNAGKIAIGSDVTLNMSGTVNNTGAITLGGVSGAPTVLEIEQNGPTNGVVLAGTGSLTLANNTENSILGGVANAQFSNASNISGAGTIGGGAASGDSLQFINLAGGVVNATGSAVTTKTGGVTTTIPAPALTISGNTAGGDNSNAGLLETTGAGGLTIMGNLDNGGAVDAVGAGALTFDDALVDVGNGVIQTTKAGASIVLEDGTSIETGTVSIVAGSKLSTGAVSGPADALETTVNNAATGAIDLAGGTTLSASGNWTNKGAINLNGAAGGTGAGTLEVDGGLTLSGGGTMNLATANTSDSIISNGTSFLTNVNNIIAGAGAIGDTNLNLTNAVGGIIDATGLTGEALTLNTGTNAINNAGTIESTGAGGLLIESSMNVGGKLIAGGTATTDTVVTIESLSGGAQSGGIEVSGGGSVTAAVAGAAIDLINSTLSIFGTISTVKGSSINAEAGTTDELDAGQDVENAGSLNVDSGATLYLNAWINNGGGTVDVGDGGEATLAIDGWGAQIVGGALVLNDDSSIVAELGLLDEFFYNSGSISGEGTIGSADLCFQNLAGGLVDANNTALTIDGDVATSALQADYNSGTIETTAGGTLNIVGSVPDPTANTTNNFTNAGVIDANTGTITFDAIVIASGGGTVETTGSGAIILDNNSVLSHGLLTISAGGSLSTTTGDTGDAVEENGSIGVGGSVNVADGSIFFAEGHWQNAGSVNLNSTGDATTIEIEAGSSWQLEGGGTVNLTGSDDSIIGAGTGALMRNNGNTIEGAGTIGDGSDNLTLQNAANGTIDANGAGGMTLNTGANGIDNAGVIQSDSASGITIESVLNNDGNLIANQGDIVAQDAVLGNGMATINGSSTIEFGAEDDNAVFFGTGAKAGGTLVLDNSSNTTNDPFFGAVTGFAHLDTIDFTDISSASATATYSGGVLDGHLTVTDGTNTSVIYMIGNYTNVTFLHTAATGGHTGTSITI